ncbi:hypothetical protein CL633_03775 [bacterium]|nr:hypothetical protein [bacterium]|tara:strand:- start:956 stop:1600 length:645 start_codon:yes stop_codon:yes gene_type:complete
MNFTTKLSTAKKFALDLVFPIQCLNCRKKQVWLCKECLKSINISKKKHAHALVTASYHNPILKHAIHVFKYQFIKDLGKPLAELIIHRIKNYESKIMNYALMPVPLHKKRLKWRGFNQAEILANHTAKHFNIPVINNALIRIKHNKPQMQIKNEKTRKQNIIQSFQCIRPDLVKNKNIILIDDVCTTGATLSECRKTLLKSGARNVLSLVLAKT